MCGRFALRNPQPLLSEFHMAIEPRFNISPNQKVLTIDKEINYMKWGFTPYWADKPFNLINARSETLQTKPSFKNSSRCVIPADGWFEWKDGKGKKEPYFFHTEGSYFFFAGVYGGYRGEVGCVVVTTEAVNKLNNIHNRMPYIIDKKFYNDWLNGVDIKEVKSISSEKISFYKVSTHVNNPLNDDIKCIEKEES